MVDLKQLFKSVKFVYLYGTDAKQSNISTNQNERKLLTTYLDPSFLVFPISRQNKTSRWVSFHLVMMMPLPSS